MSKVSLVAGSVAGFAWVVPALHLYFTPPRLVEVNRLEVSAAGDLLIDRVVHPRAPEGVGEQAILSVTIESPDDDHVCSGQRLINLRPEETPVKRWRINDWFSVPCDLPLDPGSIVHATWVPVNQDAWSITSVRWLVPADLPPL